MTGAATNGNGPRRSTFNNIDIYQGTLLTKAFTVNQSEDQRFILDNPGIDTSTIRVTVKGPQETTGREYRQVENIIDISSISEIYLLQEIADERYELLFGDGIFGKKLENGYLLKKEMFGKVIAQALENASGNSSLIKCMIRKM